MASEAKIDMITVAIPLCKGKTDMGSPEIGTWRWNTAPIKYRPVSE